MILEAKNIKRIFGEGDTAVRAVDGISITINDGEYVAIMGKSGAGKSTLLYQLSALDMPNEGSVSVCGTDVTKLNEKERTRFRLNNLGYVFQDYALVPELSAAENVMLPLLMRGISHVEAHKAAVEVLSKFGLAERSENLPSQLSGGEQQRVSIARAVVHKPKILFADEPTASLDTATSEIVLSYLDELNKAGQTIVMITHEKEYSLRAKRIIDLEDGKVKSDILQ
tara:strand:- start:7891 stop:8568 length:678 start_codon:yes stop_codon:yes gene_type:complete